MTSSPISRPVGSVKKTLRWSAAYSTSPHLLQSAAASPAACPGVPGGAEPCLVALSLYGPWVYSQRMPCRHPAHQTWLQGNTLLGAHLVTHHWDCSLSFFRGNKSLYLWTVLSQIPATRAFNNCPQTFLQFAFSVPRVFKSFPCVTSLPIPFSPSLKIASYTFSLFFFTFIFCWWKQSFRKHGMQVLTGKQAGAVQKVKTIRVSWKSWMCLTDLGHKILNSGLRPLFWSIQERGLREEILFTRRPQMSRGTTSAASPPHSSSSATFPSPFPAVFSRLSPAENLEYVYCALWSVLLSCNCQEFINKTSSFTLRDRKLHHFRGTYLVPIN